MYLEDRTRECSQPPLGGITKQMYFILFVLFVCQRVNDSRVHDDFCFAWSLVYSTRTSASHLGRTQTMVMQGPYGAAPRK
jgi:hypothetical protein